jgi:hypothetical protein
MRLREFLQRLQTQANQTMSLHGLEFHDGK